MIQGRRQRLANEDQWINLNRKICIFRRLIPRLLFSVSPPERYRNTGERRHLPTVPFPWTDKLHTHLYTDRDYVRMWTRAQPSRSLPPV